MYKIAMPFKKTLVSLILIFQLACLHCLAYRCFKHLPRKSTGCLNETLAQSLLADFKFLKSERSD